MKNVINKMLGKSKQNIHIAQAQTKIKDGLKASENALNDLAQGANGDIAPNPYLFIAILCLLITLASIGGIVHIGSQSKFIPYIIEVDKFGQIKAEGALKGAVADVRVVQAMLIQFISDARGVTADANLQKQMVFRLYAKLNPQDPATTKMNEWLNGKNSVNPFKRAETELVDIEIRTVVAQTKDTWQVEWLETVRNKDGQMQNTPQVWRALITVYTAEITKDTTDEQLRNNPLSLYVQDFNWSRVN